MRQLNFFMIGVLGDDLYVVEASPQEIPAEMQFFVMAPSKEVVLKHFYHVQGDCVPPWFSSYDIIFHRKSIFTFFDPIEVEGVAESRSNPFVKNWLSRLFFGRRYVKIKVADDCYLFYLRYHSVVFGIKQEIID